MMDDSEKAGENNSNIIPTAPDNKNVPQIDNKAAPKANNWPGGWVIVKRSIIDFFTNIVPWLTGLLAIVPLVMAFVIILFYRGNLYINIFAFILGIIGVIALLFVAVCTFSSTPVYGLARADGNKMSTRDFYYYS